VLAVAIGLVAAACGDSSGDPSGDAQPSASAERPGAPSGPDPGIATGCDSGKAAVVEPEGPNQQSVTLQEGGESSPRIDAVVYPRPDYEGDPWSQWGQGLALDDGRYVSAVGDHLGADGNSYLFVYDPATERLTRFTDVLAEVDHEEGDWGYGKVHGQLVAGRCGEALFATYWGTDDGISFGDSYQGDVLLRLDTSSLEVDPVGVPVPQHGIPSLTGAGGDGLLYGEAVVPSAGPQGSKDGDFFVYDPTAREVVFQGTDERLNGFRNVLVDAAGTAYVSTQGGELLAYEPGADELRAHSDRLPGRVLRASTQPAPDGTVYGTTQNPDRLFAFRPDGRIDDLGPAGGYTASVALHPDGNRFFYAPGAHGDSWEEGTPVVAVDTTTGERSTLVELNALAEKELGLTLGGSYSVSVDPSGERLYVGFNAGTDRKEPWGEVVLVIVHLT